MTWNRTPVAQALTALFQAAAPIAFVHERPPEILNFPSIVIMRPVQVLYGAAGLGVDDVELPVAVVHGVEQEDALEAIKLAVKQAVDGDQGLGGVVKACWANREQGWRNVTGAGGVQLLYVELILTVWM